MFKTPCRLSNQETKPSMDEMAWVALRKSQRVTNHTCKALCNKDIGGAYSRDISYPRKSSVLRPDQQVQNIHYNGTKSWRPPSQTIRVYGLLSSFHHRKRALPTQLFIQHKISRQHCQEHLWDSSEERREGINARYRSCVICTVGKAPERLLMSSCIGQR